MGIGNVIVLEEISMLLFLVGHLMLRDFALEDRLVWLHLHDALHLCTIVRARCSSVVEIIQVERAVLRCLLEEILRSHPTNSDWYAQII